MLTVALAALAYLVSGPTAGAVLLAIAVILAVVLWTPLRDWLGIPHAGDALLTRVTPTIRAGDPVLGGGSAWVTAITVVGPNRREGFSHPALEFGAIPFINAGTSAAMNDATGTVQVFDSNGLELDRAYGRWREIAMPYMNVSHWVPDGMEPPAGRIALLPNGQEHLFDVVGWDAGDLAADRCVLVRDPLQGMFRHESRRLEPGVYLLKVTLHGSDVDGGMEFRYQLEVKPPPSDWPSNVPWRPVSLSPC